MDFGPRYIHPNISPVEVIKKGDFGGTYFKNIYSGVNDKFCKHRWKEFKEFKSIDKKYYASAFYDASLNKYGVKCGTSLRLWEKKGWINKIDLYGWLQWYFRYRKGRRSSDDQRQIGRWKRIVSRFKRILGRIISKGGDSLNIRHVLLHWGYELKN